MEDARGRPMQIKPKHQPQPESIDPSALTAVTGGMFFNTQKDLAASEEFLAKHRIPILSLPANG